MKRRWYGIQVPDEENEKDLVWWLTNSEHDSWMSFFAYPTTKGAPPFRCLPIATAIRAYEGLGYKCVELEVKIKEQNE